MVPASVIATMPILSTSNTSATVATEMAAAESILLTDHASLWSAAMASWPSSSAGTIVTQSVFPGIWYILLWYLNTWLLTYLVYYSECNIFLNNMIFRFMKKYIILWCISGLLKDLLFEGIIRYLLLIDIRLWSHKQNYFSYTYINIYKMKCTFSNILLSIFFTFYCLMMKWAKIILLSKIRHWHRFRSLLLLRPQQSLNPSQLCDRKWLFYFLLIK